MHSTGASFTVMVSRLSSFNQHLHVVSYCFNRTGHHPVVPQETLTRLEDSIQPGFTFKRTIPNFKTRISETGCLSFWIK